MDALEDSSTSRREQVADVMDRPGSNVVSAWARGRRLYTPRAYLHLRALGITRLTVGAFLVVISALLLSHGDGEWAAIPLVGAALNVAVGGLDMTVAHSAQPRS